MLEAVRDIVNGLASEGINVYPSEGAISEPGQTRIIYTPRLVVQTWDYPYVRGILTMTFTIISYTPDREDSLYEATDSLINALNDKWGNRVRAYVEAVYADEATLRADVIAEWPVITNQQKENP